MGELEDKKMAVHRKISQARSVKNIFHFSIKAAVHSYEKG